MRVENKRHGVLRVKMKGIRNIFIVERVVMLATVFFHASLNIQCKNIGAKNKKYEINGLPPRKN